MQLGAFQPLLRLHSSHGNRLPWDYPQPADNVAASFLRLREALVPYTYTLADQATTTGLPMTRPLYLDYPDQANAYTNPGEYLYGPDMLVAPVTTPGNVATETVWLPPGRWVDWFTGATFDGPSKQTLTVPLDRMPVFVKAGGIVPEQPGTLNVAAAGKPLTVRVFSGARGQFSLYSDAGSGLGYQHGQDTLTQITNEPGAASSTVTSVGLTAPQGWTVTPATARSVPSVAEGSSATQNWTVTAPASAQGAQTAALQATATYTSAGSPQSVTASEQAPPASAPKPPPQITNVKPASGSAGTSITITGQNFGASQGSSFITLADLGTSWGAPFDGATLDITSWSDTSITFVLPAPQGPNGIWHLVSGTTATVTVTVTVNGTYSNVGQIAITLESLPASRSTRQVSSE